MTDARLSTASWHERSSSEYDRKRASTFSKTQGMGGKFEILYRVEGNNNADAKAFLR